MTRALTELMTQPTSTVLVDKQQAERILNEYIDGLSTEVRNTAENIRLHGASAETKAELATAARNLLKTSAPNLQKLFPVMEAAAVADDIDLVDEAKQLVKTIYPTDESVSEDLRRLNQKSRREFHTALNTTGKSMRFGQALIRAEYFTDKRFGEDFDSVIKESNWLVKEQRGTLTPQEQQDLYNLRENRRRHEERQKIEQEMAKHGFNDENDLPDDAVKFDPFAEDQAA